MTTKLFRFALVGGLGFLVDLTAMLLLSFLLPWLPARAGAFWLAASSNWWFNRKLTFSSDDPQYVRQWLNFLLSSCIGFIPSWGCYWWLMRDFSSADTLPLYEVLWPYLAMVPGVLLGMVVNFLLADRWVFSDQKTSLRSE